MLGAALSSASPSPTSVTSLEQVTVSSALIAGLRALGVTQAYGVMGGAIAPFFRTAHRELEAFHLRHEAGAAFAAIEASLCTGRPVLVFTTAGPGLSNALTGMLAARWEGARVIFISAATSASHRGRIATQETGFQARSGGAMAVDCAALHFSTSIEHPAQLGPALAQMAIGLGRPGGFVAHLSLPIDLQQAPCAPPVVVGGAGLVPRCAPEVIAAHAAMLSASTPVLWLGFGARDAAAPIRALAERLGARVMCSPRAKGIFPETHPLYLGVTGVGGHAQVDEQLAAARPAYTLVLGTRMGESSSFWAPELTPSEAFLHVDVDPAAFGAAYPGVRTHAVLADIGLYVEALREALGPRLSAGAPAAAIECSAPPLAPRAEGPVRPQVLMAELQRVIVEGSDAWLMAESGNSFCWSTNHLRFADAGRYRVSTGFGSMGHASTGVVGAALARGGKAVALVGDGAMMMLNELHSAVQYGAAALWIVLNDACYLMCAQGMSMMGWQPFSCELPRVDFVGLARAVGADGERVAIETEIGPALERAMAARGPWVLDVSIDRREAPPSGRRNRSLMQQGFAAGAPARGAAAKESNHTASQRDRS